MHIDKKIHKIKDNKIYYLNGAKWLVRETLKDEDEAKEVFKKLRKARKLEELIEE